MPQLAQTGQFCPNPDCERFNNTHDHAIIKHGETKADEAAFTRLKQRGHPEAPPSLISDGWGGIKQALIEVYRQVPPYKGRGRRPEKKREVAGWQYLQVVKKRDAQGRFLGTELRVIFGQAEQVLALLGHSTAYIERTHLQMRKQNSRLVRRSLCFSKSLLMHRAAACWEDVYYNLCHAVETLRVEINPEAGRFERRWQARTPAMAAGLTGAIWNVERILRAVPVHN